MSNPQPTKATRTRYQNNKNKNNNKWNNNNIQRNNNNNNYNEDNENQYDNIDNNVEENLQEQVDNSGNNLEDGKYTVGSNVNVEVDQPNNESLINNKDTNQLTATVTQETPIIRDEFINNQMSNSQPIQPVTNKPINPKITPLSQTNKINTPNTAIFVGGNNAQKPVNLENQQPNINNTSITNNRSGSNRNSPVNFNQHSSESNSPINPNLQDHGNNIPLNFNPNNNGINMNIPPNNVYGNHNQRNFNQGNQFQSNGMNQGIPYPNRPIYMDETTLTQLVQNLTMNYVPAYPYAAIGPNNINYGHHGQFRTHQHNNPVQVGDIKQLPKVRGTLEDKSDYLEPIKLKISQNGEKSAVIFLDWYERIKDKVSANSKCACTLKKPWIGFDDFKKDNVGYSSRTIQKEFLNAHRKTFEYILSGLDERTRVLIDNEMKAHFVNEDNQFHNIIRDFEIIDEDFHHDVNELLSKLHNKYVDSNNLSKELIRLRNIINTKIDLSKDPDSFFDMIESAEHKLAKLDPHYIPMHEETWVDTIILGLPNPMNSIKEKFLDKNVERNKKNLKLAIKNWYSVHGDRYKDKPFNPKPTKTVAAYTNNNSLEGQPEYEDNNNNYNKPRYYNNYNNNGNNNYYNRNQNQRNYNNQPYTPRPSNGGPRTNNTNEKDSFVFSPTGEINITHDDDPENITTITQGFVCRYYSNEQDSIINEHKDITVEGDIDLEQYIRAYTYVAISNEFSNQHIVFLLDSGASHHFSCNADILLNKVKVMKGQVQTMGGSRPIVGTGDIILSKKFKILDVKLVQGGTTNLVSSSKLCKGGAKIIFTKEGAVVLRSGTEINAPIRKSDIMITFKLDTDGLYKYIIPVELLPQKNIQIRKGFNYNRENNFVPVFNEVKQGINSRGYINPRITSRAYPEDRQENIPRSPRVGEESYRARQELVDNRRRITNDSPQPTTNNNNLTRSPAQGQTQLQARIQNEQNQPKLKIPKKQNGQNNINTNTRVTRNTVAQQQKKKVTIDAQEQVISNDEKQENASANAVYDDYSYEPANINDYYEQDSENYNNNDSNTYEQDESNNYNQDDEYEQEPVHDYSEVEEEQYYMNTAVFRLNNDSDGEEDHTFDYLLYNEEYTNSDTNSDKPMVNYVATNTSNNKFKKNNKKKYPTRTNQINKSNVQNESKSDNNNINSVYEGAGAVNYNNTKIPYNNYTQHKIPRRINQSNESTNVETIESKSQSNIRVRREPIIYNISNEDESNISECLEKPHKDVIPVRREFNLHNVLGHAGIKAINATRKHYKLNIPNDSNNNQCKTCINNKAISVGVGKKTADRSRKATNIMECIHVDIIGPQSIVKEGTRYTLPTIDGHFYILTVVDEFSRFVHVSALKQKSDAPEELKYIIKLWKNKTGLQPKRIQSDNGGEFVNKILIEFFRDWGIEHTQVPAYTPELNGIVERMNRTLTTMVRCMLNHEGLPLELWNYAYMHAAFINNRLAREDNNGTITPFTLIEPNHEFNMRRLHPFGCDAFVLMEPDKRGKLQTKTLSGIYLGYSIEQCGHKILLIDTLKVVEVRNVNFLDHSYSHIFTIIHKIRELAEKNSGIASKEYVVEAILDKADNYYQVKWKGYFKPTWEPLENLTNCEQLVQEFELKFNRTKPITNTSITRNNKNKNNNVSYGYMIAQQNEDLSNISRIGYMIPQSYKQALKHKHSFKWIESIKEEINSLIKQNTFTEVNSTNGQKLIDTRWVFDAKPDANGKIVRWKARLVVRGFQQQEGIDFNETFSPTVRMKSIKTMLALAVDLDLEIKQIDYDTAFLNANLQEDVYVKLPDGYTVLDKHNTKALKLNKALYGLKQAPREWYLELHAVLLQLTYNSSPLDECLYVKTVHIGDNIYYMYLSVYVDDTLAFYPKEVEHIWLKDKEAIASKFKIKDMGDCEWILHMRITRIRPNGNNPGILTLAQDSYMEQMLNEFNMSDCKATSTPYHVDDLTMVPDKVEPIILNTKDHTLYRSIIGSLLYAANITRIDLSYVVGVLARYCHLPYNYHLSAAKYVLRYIKGTTKSKLTFTSDNNNDNNKSINSIKIYTDSSWANEKGDRKSTGGWLMTYNNKPINWQVKKQSVVALSSTEAEFYALTEAIKEARYIQQWFQFYCDKQINIEVICDNQAAIYMSDHTTNHNRTKHMDMRYFYIRESINEFKIKVKWITTKEQLADILTKTLKPNIFRDLVYKLYHEPFMEKELNVL